MRHRLAGGAGCRGTYPMRIAQLNSYVVITERIGMGIRT